MSSKRVFWIGLIVGVFILIAVACFSCGNLISSLPEYVDSPEIAFPTQQTIQEVGQLPTPAIQVDVPAFEEGEIPVSAVVQILVEGMVEGYEKNCSG